MKSVPALAPFSRRGNKAAQQDNSSPRPSGPTPGLAPHTPGSRRHYRRSPFYLKIEGLTGPRPKYDEFGRLLPEGAD